MVKNTQQLDAPVRGYRLRIHRSLELHLFDKDGNLLHRIPIQDSLVRVAFVGTNDGTGAFEVSKVDSDPSLSLALRFALCEPEPTAEYLDTSGLGPHNSEMDKWRFRFQFVQPTTDVFQAAFSGIGIIDILDISILPLLEARMAKGCNPLGWLFKPAPPSPAAYGLTGMPTHFPACQAPAFAVRYNFRLNGDPKLESVGFIHVGAFMGKLEENGPAIAFLAVACDPDLLSLAAMPRNLS